MRDERVSPHLLTFRLFYQKFKIQTIGSPNRDTYCTNFVGSKKKTVAIGTMSQETVESNDIDRFYTFRKGFAGVKIVAPLWPIVDIVPSFRRSKKMKPTRTHCTKVYRITILFKNVYAHKILVHKIVIDALLLSN